MSDKLDFSLPERKPVPDKGTTGNRILLILILMAVIANAFMIVKNRDEPAATSVPGSLSSDEQKQLALKLEKQNLHSVATEAWKEYLKLAHPDKIEKAKIYYRIGKLHQDAKEYAQALDSYYRSESFHHASELESEIGRRTQECLEAMGKFAALRYELADRVGLNQTPEATGEEVVAEIGTQKISKSELDRRIEASIEQQLAQFASHMTEEDRKKQKETLLSQFSSSAYRLQFLNQYVMEEILYRNARESKLAEEPETRSLLLDSERSLLARRVISKELADSIKITASDVSTYYEANKSNYMQPERAQISHILLAEKDAAEKALEDLNEGKDFGELATDISIDSATKKTEGKIEGWITKGSPIPGIRTVEEAQTAIFETDAGKSIENYFSSDQGFHLFNVREREPERLRAFDEVRDEVYRALRSGKEQEVQQKLLGDLKERYNVVIHQSAFSQEQSATEPK